MVNSKKLSRTNDGALAQDKVRDALLYLERKTQATFVRLYDSKSAGLGSGGNAIPEQPGDFIAVLQGTSALLEVKSSIVHQSLKDTTLRSVFSENQILGARLWFRAKGVAICPFYSLVNHQFEFWDMRQIVAAYLAPSRQRKLQDDPLVITAGTPEALAEGLIFSKNLLDNS